ncbi:magnesium transporter [Hymenobacter baengnokdamensis]|uniref:magnesium transporter n=1 Tax=Hymenobacter baengnokdamensis TaxID=2615203 RepID=UPI00124674C8|nr:magnesium transporter [Hymenobacter baengnokdamensis]
MAPASTLTTADKLREMLAARDFLGLKTLLPSLAAPDLAHLITNRPEAELLILFRLLPLPQATRVFEYLTPSAQNRLLSHLAPEQLTDILNHMAPDDRTGLFERLPPEFVRTQVERLGPEQRRVALELMGFPHDSVGRLMTPDYIALREDWSTEQVFDYIRQHGASAETVTMLYVIDDKGVLLDDIHIREFLVAPRTGHVRDFMDRRFVCLRAQQNQDDALADFRRHQRVALPVTDAHGVLLGIVTLDDIVALREREDTKEIQKLGGSEALDEPYLQIPLLKMVQKRAGWLVVLFLGEMFTATAMGFFEGEIEKAVVLALFVPLVISSGGNAGSQATSLIIRAMSLGEVSVSRWWQVMRRELLAGLALGVILGIVGTIRIAVWQGLHLRDYGPHWVPLALAVGFALVGIVLWGSLAGSMLPLILKKVGFDPATSSAPFVATLVDVTGLVIYFTVAYAFLHGTLL